MYTYVCECSSGHGCMGQRCVQTALLPRLSGVALIPLSFPNVGQATFPPSLKCLPEPGGLAAQFPAPSALRDAGRVLRSIHTTQAGGTFAPLCLEPHFLLLVSAHWASSSPPILGLLFFIRYQDKQGGWGGEQKPGAGKSVRHPGALGSG